nr:MAG TPA: hypothetical protein [Caudoviricetes sp.]
MRQSLSFSSLLLNHYRTSIVAGHHTRELSIPLLYVFFCDIPPPPMLCIEAGASRSIVLTD